MASEGNGSKVEFNPVTEAAILRSRLAEVEADRNALRAQIEALECSVCKGEPYVVHGGGSVSVRGLPCPKCGAVEEFDDGYGDEGAPAADDPTATIG